MACSARAPARVCDPRPRRHHLPTRPLIKLVQPLVVVNHPMQEGLCLCTMASMRSPRVVVRWWLASTAPPVDHDWVLLPSTGCKDGPLELHAGILHPRE